jgi:hypothetical protein
MAHRKNTTTTKSRQAIAHKFEHWASNVLATKLVFQYSMTCFSGDEFVSPLQFAQWDAATKRYTSCSSSSSVTEDDIILQAMMMLFLTQMEQGWGVEKMCRQLSVWANEKKPTESDSVNLWEDEIQDLMDQGRFGQNNAFAYIDNFVSFSKFYKSPNDGVCNKRWNRKGDSILGRLHVFAEQATIQWALSMPTATKQSDMELLACSVIRELISNNNTDPGGAQALALGLELFALAEEHEHDNFCRQALKQVFGHHAQHS